jgi:predicted nucleic acid-binding protein
MYKIFIDTNVLVNFALTKDKNYKKSIFEMISSEFPRFSQVWISDLVFNETHAFLTSKANIDQSNTFMSELFSQSKDIPFTFISCFHNQHNRNQALNLVRDRSYIDESKGLSMVDALLLLQMSDDNGVIYSSDKRMSFYANIEPRIVARWVK